MDEFRAAVARDHAARGRTVPIRRPRPGPRKHVALRLPDTLPDDLIPLTHGGTGTAPTAVSEYDREVPRSGTRSARDYKARSAGRADWPAQETIRKHGGFKELLTKAIEVNRRDRLAQGRNQTPAA